MYNTVHDIYNNRMDQFLSMPFAEQQMEIYNNSEQGKLMREIAMGMAMGPGGKLPGFVERILGRFMGKITQKIAWAFTRKSSESKLVLYDEIFKSLKLTAGYRYDSKARIFKASIISVNNAAGNSSYDYFHFLRHIENQAMSFGAKEIVYQFRGINSLTNSRMLEYYKNYAQRYHYTYQEIEAGTKDGILNVILTKQIP
jgi:hypothetical protein